MIARTKRTARTARTKNPGARGGDVLLVLFRVLAVLAVLLVLSGPLPAQPLLPDLKALEPSVAEQLGRADALVRSLLADPAARPEETGEAFGELGRLCQVYGLAEPAEAAYRQALTLAPTDFRWPYLLARVLQEAGRLEEAARLYGKALALRPEFLPALVHQGEALIAGNHLDEAEVVLRKALTVDPGSAAARAALGQIALSRQRYREAADHLEAALAAVPEANRLHHPLGMAYRGLGDLDAARRHLGRAGTVGIKPPDPLLDEMEQLRRGERVHLLRGRVALRAGRAADAAAELRKAVEANPRSVESRVALGAALERAGERKAAIEQFREAARLNPRSGPARFNLGVLLSQEGDAAGAAEHLGAAAEIEPADEEIRVHEAEALVRLGQYRQAKARLEDALRQLPESGWIAHGLARLLAGAPDPGLRDGPRALNLAIRVYQARDTPEHAETLALALAENGRCDEAARLQRRLVEALRQNGQTDRLPTLERALTAYENGPPCRYGLETPQ